MALVGAVAPLTISLVLGAFLFGAAMQLADGCGSCTLYCKAGGGSPLSFVVLPTFAFGSFRRLHQPAWIELGGLPALSPSAGRPRSRSPWPVAAWWPLGAPGNAWRRRTAPRRKPRRTAPGAPARELRRQAGPAQALGARWWLGRRLLAVLCPAHLVVAGQPWGIVYGMGVGREGHGLRARLGPLGDAFWGMAPHAALVEPILADVTSVTNIGLIYGAIAARAGTARQSSALRAVGRRSPGRAGDGYSARMAFGCNVGAYLGGIASASLRLGGFALAFAGSIVGVRIRRRVGA